MDAGANEDLARDMAVVYNPLYGTVKLSQREQNAYKEIDFREIGFLYLFKGDKKWQGCTLSWRIPCAMRLQEGIFKKY